MMIEDKDFQSSLDKVSKDFEVAAEKAWENNSLNIKDIEH
jgi:hypothetical protein